MAQHTFVPQPPPAPLFLISARPLPQPSPQPHYKTAGSSKTQRQSLAHISVTSLSSSPVASTLVEPWKESSR